MPQLALFPVVTAATYPSVLARLIQEMLVILVSSAARLSAAEEAVSKSWVDAVEALLAVVTFFFLPAIRLRLVSLVVPPPLLEARLPAAERAARLSSAEAQFPVAAVVMPAVPR